MADNIKFAVIGGGSWATAIAKMLCVNLSEISWYMRNGAIEHIKTKTQSNYLSSVELKTQTNSDINEAVAADYIIFISFCFCGCRIRKTDCFLRNKIIFQPLKELFQKQA
jgi:glycerol-3-phosphate dehydrogenase (NAD(P)+)